MKTFRLKCDSKNTSRIIDERTGLAPVVIRGEETQFQIGLFQDSEFVTSVSAVFISIIDDDGNTLADGANSIGGINDLTAEMWRLNAAQLCTIEFDSAATEEPASGTHQIVVYAIHPDGSQTVYLDARLAFATHSVSAATPGTPGPPTAYTKVESDALYAPIADMTAAEADIAALEALDVVLYSAQTLTGGEKTQARTNIGAEMAGSASGSIPANEINWDNFDSWFATLTAATTYTMAGTIRAGKRYQVTLAQDATGGWNVTWPFAVDYAINPAPSAQSVFTIIANRTNSGGSLAYDCTNKQAPAPVPAFSFDVRFRSRITFSGSNISSFADILSGETWTYAGTRAAYALGMNGRPSAAFSATGYTLSSAATDILIDTAATGISVALVFDSGSTADGRILHLGPLGLAVAQNSSGHIEFGSEASSAARVKIATTLNDATPIIFIGVLHPAGGASGYLKKMGGTHAVGYGTTAAKSAASGNFEVGQAPSGTSRFTGKISLVQVYDKALTWAQVQDLAEQLRNEYF